VPAVEADDLTIRFDDVAAVDGVDFTCEYGEVTVLLGPNGAGKTSTIECLEGYRRPSAGRVRVAGLDPIREHAELTEKIGVMLQDGGVQVGIRPIEVLRQYAGFYPEPRDPDELLELVGLSHRRRSSYRSLSGGEQQRLSLAMALIGRPNIAFLDEPTAGVDLEGKRLIRGIVGDLRSEAVAVVLTTHDLEEAEYLADRIVIIDAGRVVADGSPQELLAGQEAHDFSFRADAGLDVASLSSALGAEVAEHPAGTYRVASTPRPKLIVLVAEWLAERDVLIGDLRGGRQRLDDVFTRLTGEKSEAALRGGRRSAAQGDPR
jgi:ABC-2 type transport system ATP-binding protein